MARVTHTVTSAAGAYPSAGVTVTFIAADTTNKNQGLMTGDELLIARNTGASSRTVTVESVANVRGRLGSISAESIAAGAYRIYGPFTHKEGWVQTGGYLFFEANHVEVEFAWIKLNRS